MVDLESYLHSYYKLAFWALTPLGFPWLVLGTARVITLVKPADHVILS